MSECSKAPDGGGHHWIPVRDGKWAGEPAYVMRCKHCDAPHAAEMADA